MLEYWTKYNSKLILALLEHIEIVFLSLILSLVLACLLTILSIYSSRMSRALLYFFSILYSIPSLAMFALLIPITGLGKTSAIFALTIYNQYLLLQNFITGIDAVDSSIIAAATGMGMSKFQLLYKVQIPLSKKAILAGVRIATVSTISIATIAASINAGGLGTILFDGLRTMNIVKILWGSILAIGLALIANGILSLIERKVKGTDS